MRQTDSPEGQRRADDQRLPDSTVNHDNALETDVLQPFHADESVQRTATWSVSTAVMQANSFCSWLPACDRACLAARLRRI
jgi:hypothetical protein